MARGAGIGPTSLGSEPIVLPLNDPQMVGASGLEPACPKELIYSQPRLPLPATLPKMAEGRGLEPLRVFRLITIFEID
jgi:hypothetical protein